MGLFLVVLVVLGLRYAGEAGKSVEQFFVGGRSLPWYWAGLSMVATTFAADTPLAVNELVTTKGISGNWLWWSFLAGGMLTTFFFARLWQRSGVLTEAELIELRYGSGTTARRLRGFKAVYLGLLLNGIIIAWVNVAMLSLLQVFFDLSYWQSFWAVAALMLLTMLYSSASGLKGVVMTDALQFVVAMLGCIVLAYIVLHSPEIGGMEALKEKVVAKHGEGFLSFFPAVGSWGEGFAMGTGALLTYICIQWWAVWYPGAEPGGGGYIAQRMMSTRSERDAVWATLLFQIAHYCLRPWAWIVVALAASILYPTAGDNAKMGYVYAMRDFLPEGLRGLLLAAFFAAYMSTISTQINWGASLLVNDLYKRFLSPNLSEAHYVSVARWATAALAGVGLAVTPFLDSISAAWGLLMQFGAGLGGVLIVRWYWQRVSAESEIAAMLAPILPTLLGLYFGWEFPAGFLFTVLFTTLVWVGVTFLVRGDEQAAAAFRLKVHGEIPHKQEFYLLALLSLLLSVALAYSVLFGIGKLILLEYQEAAICGTIALLSALGLRWSMNQNETRMMNNER